MALQPLPFPDPSRIVAVNEYARGEGVSSLGLEEPPSPPPNEEERKGILDLFRR